MPTMSEIIQRYSNAKTAISQAITAKGGTVNPGDGFEDFSSLIGNITTGTTIDLYTATYYSSVMNYFITIVKESDNLNYLYIFGYGPSANASGSIYCTNINLSDYFNSDIGYYKCGIFTGLTQGGTSTNPIPLNLTIYRDTNRISYASASGYGSMSGYMIGRIPCST